MSARNNFIKNSHGSAWCALLSFVTACSLFLSVANGFGSDTVTLGGDELVSGIPGPGKLKEAELDAWLKNEQNHRVLDVSLPDGLNAAEGNIVIPSGNPITRAKIELGRQLYFDPRLSADGSVSCASCHDPEQGFGAFTQFGVGIRAQTGNRNSPVSYNRIVSRAQFWDGRASSLEEQAIGPIANPLEMGNTHQACVDTLKSIPGYRQQFQSIFKDGLTIENVGKAIATFERVIVTGPTAYDRYLPIQKFRQTFADDLDDLDGLREDLPDLVAQYEANLEAYRKDPMSPSAERGMKLFFSKANCATCHAGANFTDEQYHNLGVGMDAEQPDLGRFVVTGDEKDKGAFKTPTLRNVAMSRPYMHDGSQETLEEVVEWYAKGGHPNPTLSDKMKKLTLTKQGKADLVTFMKEGLKGRFPEIQRNRLPQ